MEDPGDACLALGPFKGHPETGAQTRLELSTARPLAFLLEVRGLAGSSGVSRCYAPPIIDPLLSAMDGPPLFPGLPSFSRALSTGKTFANKWLCCLLPSR